MFCIVSHFLYFVLHVFFLHFGGGHVFAFFVFFMFFFRFVFRVCCERPCEQLSLPKLRFVLCFFSDLFSVCVANVPASNFLNQNSDLFGPPCDQEVPLFRCFASDLHYQNCDVQVPCEHPCWAVPCTILTLCARSLFLFSSKNRRALYYSHTGTRY